MCAKVTGRDWKLRVNDIPACIDKIRTYTAGMTFKNFYPDIRCATPKANFRPENLL